MTLMVLLKSWQKQKVTAVFSVSLLLLFIFFTQWAGNLLNSQADQTGAIPEEAIRLRILANSNSAADQALKRSIRDAVVADVDGWVAELNSSDKARQVILSHLDDLRATVQKAINDGGSDQTFHLALKKAKFPTKMYGGYVYPAGEYKALVITLGKGTGANWWCVLFPPLCFLDFSQGDAVKPENNTAQAATADEPAAKPLDQEKQPDAEKEENTTAAATSYGTEKQVQVKFITVEWFHKLTDMF